MKRLTILMMLLSLLLLSACNDPYLLKISPDRKPSNKFLEAEDYKLDHKDPQKVKDDVDLLCQDLGYTKAHTILVSWDGVLTYDCMRYRLVDNRVQGGYLR